MFDHDFVGDFLKLEDMILNKEHFALARYADGEFHVMNGMPCQGIDGWRMDPSKTKIQEDLTKAFKHTEENYYYGISCPCCDKSTHEWFLKNCPQPVDRLTFSNIFVNANQERTKALFYRLEKEKPDVIPIINENCTNGS